MNQAGTYGTQGVAAPGNAPGARTSPAAWTDASGNLWLFGGYNNATVGSGEMNDLWKFNVATGQWTWVNGSNQVRQAGRYGTQGAADPQNVPGAREASVRWTDASGNLWIFGGGGYAASGPFGYLNDLWKWNLASGQWTWVSGSNQSSQIGKYGTQGIADPGSAPGCRENAVSWIDTGGNLWLFGGGFSDTRGNWQNLNDLWKFDVSSGMWTWVSGSNQLNQSGKYGAPGVPTPGIAPGARWGSASWTDAGGNLWLFGGYGNAASGLGDLNDLWKYSISTGLWAWVGGSSRADQTGTYGAQGVPAPANVPGARDISTAWTDARGNLWLFGGYGFAASGQGELNDLWKYNISSGLWAWVSGNNRANQDGTYGTQGAAAPGNVPGGRDGGAPWTDATGNMWLLGGHGYAASGTNRYRNDLWVFSAPSDPQLLLPVVLDVSGVGGSHYTTELTLASKTTTATTVRLLYTASVGAGTGTVPLTLAPGETRIIPDAISFLRSQGLPIPTSGSAVGTLSATFLGASSPSDVFIGGRTFTTGGGGTFGLFYPGAATTTTAATLVGLQQSEAQRSNLALANAGETPVTLRVQLLGPMGEDLGTLPDQTLPPYGWTQLNQPLQDKALSGRAVVTEVSGSSPFTAYAVLNDAVTSDGSFIPPLVGNDSGPGERLVPIILDVNGIGGSHYTTELTLANLTSGSLPVILAYTASLGSGSGQATLTLAPGEQRIVPDAIGLLRSQGLPIPSDGSNVGGSLLVLPPSNTPASAFAVGARTFTPASSGGGTFGLYTPGLTLAESASSVAFVNGLQQNPSQRSNLAVVNRGDAADTISLAVAYFDANGAALGTPTAITLSPGQWTQFGQPLQALGATSGYARIERTSGTSRFVAYGVLNDAATSDGSYIPMSR